MVPFVLVPLRSALRFVKNCARSCAQAHPRREKECVNAGLFIPLLCSCLNGWQLSSLLTIHTGPPFNVTTDTDNSGTNENFQRPNLIGDPFAGVSHSIITDSDGSKYVQWVNPAAFAQPADGTFGNLSRYKFYGPAYGSVDFSIFKNTKITERVTAQLRFEFYNLLNHNNWETPNTNPFTQSSGWAANSTNGFGRITDTIGSFNGAPGIGPGEPFNTQIALKIIF
jgi:hypothetical protein